MDDLVKLLRGFHEFWGDEIYRDAAERIESQAAEITAKQRIIDAQAGVIAEMQRKHREEIIELRGQMLSDQWQHFEETGRLRNQISALKDFQQTLIVPDNTPGDGDKTMGDA